MLRMPQFQVERPATLEEALALLAAPGAVRRPVAGGTDLLPNLKHRLVDVDALVDLGAIAELKGVARQPDGALALGAMATLDAVAQSDLVRAHAPALALAASQISGPQLRRMGTLGGNLLLDTRCRYINQTHFWRKALGYCLKKDGTVCHVVAGGSRCVAAASNDTLPALMTLGAKVVLRSATATRTVPVEDLYQADGAKHLKLLPGELLVKVLVPAQRAGHRGAYLKLRSREAIDFPLLGVAARVDVEGGAVVDADVAVVALAARAVRLKGVKELLLGKRVGEAALTLAIAEAALRAFKQCHPMPNVNGDHEWRHEMVPVFVRRALVAALGSGA